MPAAKIALNVPEPFDDVDQHVVLRGVRWVDYEALLAIRGDERPGVRLYYLKGDLELMSPSQSHEWIKKTLARMLEAYADATGIDVTGYGSLTMRRVRKERGAEPDECYVIGPSIEKDARPDLAIEVVWTSGGLDKLEIYSGLGVRELWVCRTQKKKLVLDVLSLRRGRYVTVDRSRVLPDLDLGLITKCLDSESQTQAVRSFRTALGARTRKQ